eukprot:1668398-Rhodomonas_salina.2
MMLPGAKHAGTLSAYRSRYAVARDAALPDTDKTCGATSASMGRRTRRTAKAWEVTSGVEHPAEPTAAPSSAALTRRPQAPAQPWRLAYRRRAVTPGTGGSGP